MNLVTHVLRKDIRHTRVMLSVWLVLVVLQFALLGWGVNPGDHLMQALYSILSMLVPLFQALVLIVLIPHVVQDEPLVGTTAFWFTRPISRGTLLKSKVLFALLVLVLPPLIAEVIVLAANGVTGHDISLAVPEIVMQHLALILAVAVLAVVTSNFGRFAILGAVVVVAMMLISLAITWMAIYLNPQSLMDQASHFSLTKSRGVAGSVLMILGAGGLIAHQYLTRNTARTMAGAIIGLALVLAAQHFWPLDFLKPPAPAANDTHFDAGAIKAALGGNVNASDVMSFRGQGSPRKDIRAQIETEGVPKGYVVEVKGVHSRVTPGDGPPQDMSSAQNQFYVSVGEPNVDALEFALNGTPIVNLANESYFSQTELFSVDADTYAKFTGVPLKYSASVDFVASRYVLTVEMPLEKGSRYDHDSEHVVITAVLHQPDGIDIVLQQRKLHLLFDTKDDQNPQLAFNREKVVYLLLNKKRREAVIQKQDMSANINFQMSSGRLQNQPLRVSFGPDPNRSQLTPDLTPEWLADASLVRLELTPVAAFSKEIAVDKFTIAGEIPFLFHRSGMVSADPEALRKITLPANPTKEQVKEYVDAILVASRKQNRWSDHDPQVGMLEKIGPENLDVLIGYANHGDSGGRHEFYVNMAIERLASPDDKALILQALATDRDLADLVVKYGWQADARDTLVAVLDQEKQFVPPAWVKAVALLQDPSTYPALKAYLVNGSNRQQTFNDIKQLPGIDLSDSVDEMWKKAKYGNPYVVLDVCGIAAEYGHADALDTAAGILKKEKNQYDLRRAREVITKFTPATGDDATLLAWLQSNRDRLGFDKGSKKFVLQK